MQQYAIFCRKTDCSRIFRNVAAYSAQIYIIIRGTYTKSDFLTYLDKQRILCYNLPKVNIVHFEEVEPINPVITSKEEIMQICHRIASEEGLKSLGMRKVAKECGIAIGTLYNYFPNKEELLIATITSIWLDIFSLPVQEESSSPLLFSEYVEKVFENVRGRFRDYPDFFTAHSVAITESGKDRARKTMENCTKEIRNSLLSALRRDNAVSVNAFSESFTEESFTEFVMDSIILLLSHKKSCSTLISVIKKVIYEEGF